MTSVSDAIRTQRLLLRPLRVDDVQPLFSLFSNWEVIRWLSSPPWPYTLGDAGSFVDTQLSQAPANKSYLAITLDGTLIGGIDTRDSRETEDRARSPILGYWLGQPYWGRGYMTEAAGGFIGHIFASTSVDSIHTGAFAGNAASLRVQEKLGFERTGERMLYCRPRGEKLAHVNTKLARSRFLAQSR
jgi:RimJ/RimL family protein N-acetyltransferase